MDLFVVYLKDYEQHKKIICVVSMEQQAIKLCATLNTSCEKNLSPIELDELSYFAERNGFVLDRATLRAPFKYGDHFDYEKVNYVSNTNYSGLNAGWDDTFFDACTSDYYPYLEEDDHDVEFDYNFDYEHGVDDWMDCSHVNTHKLRKLVKTPGKPKNFSKEVMHPDPYQRMRYYDPIHKFCHNKGYRNASNKLHRMIKMRAITGVHINTMCDIIKSCVEYKRNLTFRRAARWYLDGLNGVHGNSLFKYSAHYRTLHDCTIVDGVLWTRESASKYTHYEYVKTRVLYNGKFCNMYKEV